MKSNKIGILSAAAIGIAIVIMATSIGFRVLTLTQSTTRPYSSSLLVTTNSTSTTSISSTKLYSTSSDYFNSALNLKLGLSVNATRIISGQGINISVSDTNQLPTENNVTVVQSWALYALTIWGCPHPPVGIAVFKGFYTYTNISSATGLQIVEPGNWGCPAVWVITKSLTFNSSSDMLISLLPEEASIPLVMNLQLYGYYNENSAQYGDSGYDPNSTTVLPPYIIPFSPGIYTIAGGDEWGSLAILYLTVS